MSDFRIRENEKNIELFYICNETEVKIYHKTLFVTRLTHKTRFQIYSSPELFPVNNQNCPLFTAKSIIIFITFCK